jgi:hypothetical protein
MRFSRSRLTNAKRIPQIDRWQRLNGFEISLMVTVNAVLVVTWHSFFEGFKCNYRLDSPLSALVRRDNS